MGQGWEWGFGKPGEGAMNFNLPAVLFLLWTLFTVFVFFPKHRKPEGHLRGRIRWYLIWMSGLILIALYSYFVWAPAQEAA
jgi:hypothetical protein